MEYNCQTAQVLFFSIYFADTRDILSVTAGKAQLEFITMAQFH